MFTQPEWQASPWKNRTKGADQKLCDIGAELSTILTSADRSKLTQDNKAFSLERIALLQDCQNLASKLEAWFQQLSEEIPAPHYWPEFSNIQTSVDEREGRKIFPVSFRFPNIYIAKVMIDYWALSIVLYSTSLLLYRSFTAPKNSTGPEHPADGRYTQVKAIPTISGPVPKPIVAQDPGFIKSLADNIAQSMEYCLSRDMGILGPQWALFALRSALQTYQYFPDSKELQWLQAIHNMICDEKGLKFSKIIAASVWEKRT